MRFTGAVLPWGVLLFVLGPAADWSQAAPADKVAAPADQSAPTAKAPTTDGQPRGIELDDPVEPLVPKVGRTPADRDRIEAMTLFTAGRLHEQRQEYAEALKMYQRALRFDPDSLAVLRQIVPLAFNLDRSEEAVRYALKVVELDPSDIRLMQRLAAHLTDRRDYEGAVKLYERALKVDGIEKKSPSYISLMLQMGDLYFLLEDYQHAADCYVVVEKGLDNPDDFGITERQKTLLLGSPATTFERFGMAYLKADRPKQAIEVFQKADKAAPNKGLWAFHRAQVLAAEDKPAEALAELEVYFQHQLKSQGGEPYELLAKVLKDLDKQGELVGRLEKLVDSDKKNPALRYYLADQLRAAGKLDEAEKMYLETLEETPHANGYEGLLAIYRQQKQPLKLLETLGNGATTGEELLTRPEGKAILQDEKLVGSILDAARKLAKEDAEKLTYGMRTTAAMLATEVKQFDAVNQFFQLALDTNPPDELQVYQQWGLSLLVGEQYDESAKVFQQAIDKKIVEPGDPTLHFHLSAALEMGHHTEQAVKVAREAAGMRNPPLPVLEKRIAWIYYHAQQWEDAIKEYERLIEEFSGQPTAKEARLLMSNIYVIMKDMPKAEEYLEQVLDEYPDDPGASNDLGYLWADQGKNLQRGLKMVQLAVESDPDNSAYQDSLGWAYYKLGRYEEALIHLKKAVEGDEDPDAVLLDHLADCYLRLNELDKARELWQKGLAAAQKADRPDKDVIARIQKKLDLHQGKQPGQLDPGNKRSP